MLLRNQDEEHHTDNDDDDIEQAAGAAAAAAATAISGARLSFEKLAAANSDKTNSGSFLDAYQPPSSKRPSLVPTDNSHEDDYKERLDEVMVDEKTDDSLSSASSEDEMDMDDRLAIQYYDCYSKGNRDWCQEYRVHGPECRKCRQRGNCSFPCSNEPKYQCKLCGLWSHHESQCPDQVPLEYRKNWNITCIYCSNSVSSLILRTILKVQLESLRPELPRSLASIPSDNKLDLCRL